MVSTFAPYAWLVPVFPLLSFLILTALGRGAKWAGPVFGVASSAVSFVLAFLVFWERADGSQDAYTWNDWVWIEAGAFKLQMGFEVNNINALMLVIVTLVSAVVNLYSAGYMREDERKTIFFAYVSFFTFSMLGLVLSCNIVMLYIFWELVGLCSFLLIGFWYSKPEAKAAAKKAFLVTRIGDAGLLIAILMLFWVMPGGALDFNTMNNAFVMGDVNETAALWIAILLFLGAVGKSGQFPLHVWLPDAMEGPTPISALIHAATMVAAGVYLVARTYPVFMAAPVALEIVTYIGAFTALFAAIIATAQHDIKRVLAYSTISQLGYMMMALGLGTEIAMAAAMFHLFTHAFFKALLFLGAGSVIQGAKTQDIREMGGLFGSMKLTAITFAVGALALAGVVPLAGFWSKDAILTQTLHQGNGLLFAVGIIAAFLTAFYMTRLYMLVFMGSPRSNHTKQAQESPWVMTVPLIILAVPSVLAGFVNLPGEPWLTSWLNGKSVTESADWLVIVLSTAAAVLGIAVGYVRFRNVQDIGDSSESSAIRRIVENKFYMDEWYQAVVVTPYRTVSNALYWFDANVVGGAVKLAAAAMLGIGRIGARLQNGQMQTYGLMIIFGCLFFIAAIAGRRFF